MLSKDMYSGLSEIATDELYAISGSGFGFPSDRYDDLELGASGTEYTAPANGYYAINKTTSASNQYVTIGNATKNYNNGFNINASGSTGFILFPVQKGDVVVVTYTAAGTTGIFRFIYAEGE